jgi:hypothetical protein
MDSEPKFEVGDWVELDNGLQGRILRIEDSKHHGNWYRIMWEPSVFSVGAQYRLRAIPHPRKDN